MLQELFTQAGLNLSSEQLEKFDQFLHIFQEKNEQLNLSAIRDEQSIIIKHFIDSLSITPLPQYQSAQTVVDVGSGGGFPGIPLAIYSPDKQFLLNDSIDKKVFMIKYFIQFLGLTNVKTDSSRAEELGQSHHREFFDLCIARAVARLATLCEYCLPLVHIGGHFIAYKEENPEEVEQAQHAIELLGGRLEKIHFYRLPDVKKQRELMIIRKTKSAPKEYPRRVGVPSKKPL